MMSMGKGKMTVEFFSAEIEFSVWAKKIEYQLFSVKIVFPSIKDKEIQKEFQGLFEYRVCKTFSLLKLSELGS